MSARWSERQDGRDAGRAESVASPTTPGGGAGCPIVAVPLAVAGLYVGIHMLVWLGRVSPVGLAATLLIAGALAWWRGGTSRLDRILRDELRAGAQQTPSGPRPSTPSGRR
ncbi:hypothetical protein [Prauserella flavalba]|uniref:Uncharacterized protein n=1 Tax=Prauserella flavalba TaxID=1477506 RepID=A0A318LBV2_9PSEU|nr:hypothetical protein [Prauserella flavalba]PXY16487.1 hypothetical protein BA062_38780 [Prauserella flavalba]